MSWQAHPFGYCPDAWYSRRGSRRYLPIAGFVYKKIDHAGKMTSTVFTFCGADETLTPLYRMHWYIPHHSKSLKMKTQ